MAALLLSCLPAGAGAGEQASPSSPPPRFLSHYDFHLGIAALSGSRDQFAWDADCGGDLDLLDYGKGRVNFPANFEAIMGTEFQPFDPNQGNYTLAVSSSYRLRHGELSGIFHHVSRHLGDRAKDFPIDWNMVGLEYLHHRDARRLRVEGTGRVLWTTKRSFVDYEVMVVAGVSGRYIFTDRVAWIGAGEVTTIGVDRAERDRGTQRGATWKAVSGWSGTRRRSSCFWPSSDASTPTRETSVPGPGGCSGSGWCRGEPALPGNAPTRPSGPSRPAPPARREGSRHTDRLGRCAIITRVRTSSRRRGAAPAGRRRVAKARAHALLLALVVAGLVPGAARAQVETRPPKLDYTITTLPNGLTVVLSEDHSTPIVHLQLWYHVGSKNERPGRTGFAHLFEHLMFKGSKNVQPEEHLSMISGVGGETNATTNEDTTIFWETVPAHYLPVILWLEADRMASLRIDRRTLDAERVIVKEERRMRVDNQPFGRLNEIIYDQAFTVHPYKHTVIGSMEDLEAASVDDVREFYETYYVPDNATLVLVGDFDAGEALELVIRHLGRVPKASRPVPRDIPTEPSQKQERRVTLEEDWPLPAVVVSHLITYDGHPDSYPLHIASKILSDGQSSRIHRKLVYEEQVAIGAFGGGNIIEHPNLFFAVAIVQSGRTPAEAEAALIAELEQLKNEPVSEAELQRAKNQFARDYIIGRESNQQKAGHLAHAAVIHDDVTTTDGEFDIFMGITAEDVQRVARTYFTEQSRLVLQILPKARGQ